MITSWTVQAECKNWSAVGLAPGEKIGNSCEKVGHGASWQQRVWKLGWGRSWKSLRMQLDVDVDCGYKGKDIVDVNVGICPFCPPPVSQIQKLLGEERTMRRQVSRSSKIPQKENALPSTVPLQMLREPVALKSSADRFPPPMQAFRQ